MLTVSYPGLHTFRGRVCSGASWAGNVVESAERYRARERAMQEGLGTGVQRILDISESPGHSETLWISREK